jgi:hypothetical protein
MILHCSFEELSAVNESAGRVLAAAGAGGVAAPPEVIADIEALSARLQGDLAVESLHELRSVTRAIEYLLGEARIRTDLFILEQSPAAEPAILSYFEYAHLLTLMDRAVRLGDQMAALIEVMTGAPVTEEAARHFSFPE